MFSTLKSRISLGVYILLLIAIPIGTYLVSQQQSVTSKAVQPKKTKVPLESTPSASVFSSPPAASPTLEPTATTSFGPTLSLKVVLEARPAGNYATRLFVGIAEGVLTTNPKFLLSFAVELPSSGEYSNLSLAGLTPGTRYIALLKGQAQIATSSAFIMSPVVSNLNNGQVLNMLAGDLNDDNIVNDLDYSIAKKAYAATASSPNWNENADLNKDGIVNTIDLSIISKNLNKVGDSGMWISPLPKGATPSASSGQAPSGTLTPSTPSGGYWFWMPGF